MTDTKPTSSEIEQGRFTASLRSRDPFIVVVSPEEARVKPYIFAGAEAAGFETRFWSVAQGFTDLSGKVIMGDRGQGNVDEALAAIKENKSRVVWVMLDLLPWITAPIGLITQRALRDLIDWLPNQGGDCAQSIVMVTSTGDLPREIASDATVIAWPMPDREEMGGLLDEACAPVLANTALREDGTPRVSDELKAAIRASITGDSRVAAVDAAIGLSGAEAKGCFARSLATLRRIDPPMLAEEKKRAFAKEKVLEFIDSLPGGFAAVGGLDDLKDDVRLAFQAYSPEAREYGLELPKGVLLVGYPGCGKTYIAKAIGGEYNIPTLYLDLGALKGKFVGESEANLRRMFGVAEALGRVVIVVDEIEKALAGATGESADGGVSADALGALLSWMNDRKSEAFIVATANNVDKLPPELLRKGRFDQLWWVDLPTAEERASILAATVGTHQRRGARVPDVETLDLGVVAASTQEFSGAEVASLVRDAMRIGFSDGRRPIITDDLLRAAKAVTPQFAGESRRTRPVWAKPAARHAIETAGLPGSRQLEI